MERLIDDLLTFARAGSEALSYTTVELGQVLDGCWERTRTDGGSLTVETDESIRADRARLQQLLENLLLNAVEHGGSDVSITAGSLADGFYIEDDGPGIPESKRDDVLEAGHSTSQEGTGFGLSIVAAVAEAHGWELNVTDGSDGGARFELTGVEFAGP
jgi:signal transduction histidine kinase